MTKKLEPSDYLGAEVIVTGGAGAEWRGTAIAYQDHPSLMIQQENGMRMMLSADNVRLAEPRPAWHDAKPGEVWVLKTEGVDERWNPTAFTVTDGGSKFVPVEPGYSISHLGRMATAIIDARRIFPEVSNA